VVNAGSGSSGRKREMEREKKSPKKKHKKKSVKFQRRNLSMANELKTAHLLYPERGDALKLTRKWTSYRPMV